MRRPKVGLALGSGAARGWSHIGVIETLHEERIPIDIVTGCSMGAFVGAAYVTGKFEEVKAWALTLRWQDIAQLIDITIDGGGLIEGARIEKLMKDFGIAGDIENLDMPFASVATDYLTGREEWFQTGDIGRAVRASVALPGLLTPMEHDGDFYVDGGLVNPVPVSLARALGAKVIIAVNLNAGLVGRRTLEPKTSERRQDWIQLVTSSLTNLPPVLADGAARAVDRFMEPKPSRPGYFDVLANSINIMQDQITRSRLSGETPHVLMSPRLTELNLLDFDKAGEAIEEGRRVARAALPDLRHFLTD